MVKATCGECAYTIRTTRRWLEELGPPLCPCNSLAMEVPDAEVWDQEAWIARQSAVEVAPTRTLRDRWVYTRALHDCTVCREEIQRDDYAHHRVYTVGSEFFSEYRHLGCATGNPQGR